MIANEFVWREFRKSTIMTTQIPLFIDCQTTGTPSYKHHASLYGIREEDARLQSRIGNTKNRKVVHYSSELVIDTDDYETAVNVWETLCKKDLYFELWKLNNFKFYLKRDSNDQPNDTMCYQDRQYVRETFFNCSGISKLDTGIYCSPFHLCRAKNSVHEITKAKSILIETYKGKNLVETNDIELKIYEKPLNSHNFNTNLSTWSQLQNVIDNAIGDSSSNHMDIWKFAKDLSKFCSHSTAEELILIYAKSLNYDETKAIRAFNQGFTAGRE